MSKLSEDSKVIRIGQPVTEVSDSVTVTSQTDEQLAQKETFALLSGDASKIKEFWDAIQIRYSRALASQDPIQLVYIRADAMEAYIEGLANLKPLPEYAEQDPSFAERFELMKSSINTQEIPLDRVEANIAAGFPVIVCSFQSMTHHEINAEFLRNWKDSIGLGELLEQRGTPFVPSYQELRLLYLLHAATTAIQQDPASRILHPKVGQVIAAPR